MKRIRLRSLRDYRRGVANIFRFLVMERPRGLNFSMRVPEQSHDSRFHGYAMTSDAALQNIARIIDFLGKSLIDIGSGKGRVLYQAIRLGASRAEGIEISKELHEIAVKNLEKLGVSQYAISNHQDATTFSRFAEFDIFFLFNPFAAEIYELVVDQIISQVSTMPKLRYLVCYGAANLASVDKHSHAIRIYQGVCPHRRNSLAIYALDSRSQQGSRFNGGNSPEYLS